VTREEQIRAAAMQIAVEMWGSSVVDSIADDKPVLDEVIRGYIPIARRIEEYIVTGK
jgi:hypothetical protein